MDRFARWLVAMLLLLSLSLAWSAEASRKQAPWTEIFIAERIYRLPLPSPLEGEAVVKIDHGSWGLPIESVSVTFLGDTFEIPESELEGIRNVRGVSFVILHKGYTLSPSNIEGLRLFFVTGYKFFSHDFPGLRRDDDDDDSCSGGQPCGVCAATGVRIAVYLDGRVERTVVDP